MKGNEILVPSLDILVGLLGNYDGGVGISRQRAKTQGIWGWEGHLQGKQLAGGGCHGRKKPRSDRQATPRSNGLLEVASVGSSTPLPLSSLANPVREG